MNERNVHVEKIAMCRVIAASAAACVSVSNDAPRTLVSPP